MIDLLIAGGGPAGLATAIEGALAGLECVVVDPSAGTIDKACGEGLMPPALVALDRLGVRLGGGVPFRGVRFVDGDTVAEGRFRGGHGLGVRRTLLHDALLARTNELGIRRIQGRVDDFLCHARGVFACGVHARWLVAADGLHSPIRRRLGFERRTIGVPRYGVRRHFRVEPWSEFVEVHWSDEAEAYVTPVAPDLVGVAILSSHPAPFEAGLARFPALAARLGTPSTRARGAGPFGRVSRHRIAARVAFVGDAAGFLDPLTGEGVRLALLSARALVSALVSGRPDDYERAWRRIVRRYWMLTSGLLWLRRSGPLRRRLVPTLRRAPWLFDAALAFLTDDPDVLSPRRSQTDRLDLAC